MPLYTYHCKECDKDAELLVRSTETPVCRSLRSPRAGTPDVSPRGTR
jgi:putative FmdB family regulatory protein